MLITASIDRFLALMMCSTGGMSFPAPPRLSHLPHNVNTNCQQNGAVTPITNNINTSLPQQQQQSISNTASVVEFTSTRHFTAFDQPQPHSITTHAMYDPGAPPAPNYTASLAQDPPPSQPTVEQQHLQESHTQQPQTEQAILPSNMTSYFENTYTRTLTGLYLPPASYRLNEDIYPHVLPNIQTSSGYMTSTAGRDDGENSYKGYTRSSHENYMHTGNEQDAQVSSGTLATPPFYSTQNPYSLYRNSNFTNAPDSSLFSSSISSKFGGKSVLQLLNQRGIIFVIFYLLSINLKFNIIVLWVND